MNKKIETIEPIKLKNYKCNSDIVVISAVDDDNFNFLYTTKPIAFEKAKKIFGEKEVQMILANESTGIELIIISENKIITC